jgi:hypothetical protein
MNERQGWAEAAKAEEAARRHRAELERDLIALVGFRNPKFDPAEMDDLDRAIEMCPFFFGSTKRGTWNTLMALRKDRDTWRAAIAMLERSLPPPWPGPLAEMKKTLAIIDANIEHHEKFLGAGDSAGRVWHRPARLLRDRVFKILQSADKAAGREVRSARYTEPILEFIREKLIPVCEQAGEDLPSTNAIRQILADRN